MSIKLISEPFATTFTLPIFCNSISAIFQDTEGHIYVQVASSSKVLTRIIS